MLEMVIEIGMEQARLFHCRPTLFYCVDLLTIFVIEIVIDFFQIEQCSF